MVNNMKMIINLIKKYKEVIMYLIFGILTTVVNIVVYFISTRFLNLDAYISNIIAWVLSVLFAFVTNKVYVFNSKNTTVRVILKEGISFFGFRVLSLIFDMICMYIFISLLSTNDLVAKIITNVVVIIINYLFSKLFVFKSK